MILFQTEEFAGWKPDGFLADLEEHGFDHDLFSKVQESPGSQAVFRPKTSEQESLLRLFVEGAPVPLPKVQEILKRSWDGLVRLGILIRQEDQIKTSVRIRAAKNGLFAEDFPTRLLHSPGDYVMGVAATTRMAKLLVPPTRPRKILDLCCGGGWLAIGLSGPGTSVTGTDLNPRAIEMARFNALLNRVPDIEWKVESWYAAVEEETFDLIVANPPFVMSPGGQSIALDTENNHGILPDVLEGLPQRLNPDGFATMLLDWPFLDEEDWSAPVLKHLERKGLQVFLFEVKRWSPREYARNWVGQDPRFEDEEEGRREVARWIRSFEERKLPGVSSGFLVVRKCQEGCEWVMTESRQINGINTEASRDLLRIFEGRRWLHENRKDLLELKYRVIDGLAKTSGSVMEKGVWKKVNLRLQSPGLVAYDGHIDEGLLGIIEAASAGKLINECLVQLAKPLGVEPEAIREQVRSLVRELVTLGILVPAED